MAVTILFKRGLKDNIPDLAVGEPGFCTDTKELFVGSSQGNKLVGEGTFLELSGGTLTGPLTLPPVDPRHPHHAANKAYVDSVASGLDVKASVVVCEDHNLPMVQVEDDGNQFEALANGPVYIDGTDELGDGDRFLLVGQTNPAHNGIFEITDVGSASTKAKYRRTLDALGDTLTLGSFTFVEKETHAGTGWVCISTPSVDGTIQFTQFSGAGAASFLSLADTPSSYNLQRGRVVRVNSVENGLEFVDPSLLGRVNFIELDDTPENYTASSVPAVNTAGNELVWVTKESLGLQKIESFGDFAGRYQQNGGKMLRVAANESGLEYFSPDLTPNIQHGDIPIASRWAAGHESASSGIHGAPSGVALLHQNSTIDGGTFDV